MSEDVPAPILLLCVGCRTAVVADTAAKRNRIPRWTSCPVCGSQAGSSEGESWKPVRGTEQALAELEVEYSTVEAESLEWWP